MRLESADYVDVRSSDDDCRTVDIALNVVDDIKRLKSTVMSTSFFSKAEKDGIFRNANHGRSWVYLTYGDPNDISKNVRSFGEKKSSRFVEFRDSEFIPSYCDWT